MKNITINNIKNINYLSFDIPTKSNVYLLTGANGIGKSTLLSCLYRIGYSNAFMENFKKSNSSVIDQYTNSSVKYTVDNECVTYRKDRSRWEPSPRKNKAILQKFGYDKVLFFPPNQDRLFVQDNDLKPHKIKSAEKWMQDAMNYIFESSKYSELKQLKVDAKARGRKAEHRTNVAYLLPTKIAGKTMYYSEKNFSLGEILVLNLLLQISHINDSSLILIDEIELALYPKAQIKLYDYLTEKAKSKKLTIILSTHSTSLIKHSSDIILLKSNGKQITAEAECFASVAECELSCSYELRPDKIYLVEDIRAARYLRSIIKRVSLEEHISCDYRILHIGTYGSVAELHSQLNKSIVKKGLYSFVDGDIDNIVKVSPRLTIDKDFMQIWNNQNNIMYTLPDTPEVALINDINNKTQQYTDSIKKEFANNAIQLSEVTMSADYMNLNNECANINEKWGDINYNTIDLRSFNSFNNDQGSVRKKRKRQTDMIVTYLNGNLHESIDNIEKFLFDTHINLIDNEIFKAVYYKKCLPTLR